MSHTCQPTQTYSNAAENLSVYLKKMDSIYIYRAYENHALNSVKLERFLNPSDKLHAMEHVQALVFIKQRSLATWYGSCPSRLGGRVPIFFSFGFFSFFSFFFRLNSVTGKQQMWETTAAAQPPSAIRADDLASNAQF